MPRKRKEKPLVLKGWQCPVCSRVMAPHVTSCERCVGVAPVSVPTPIWIAPLPWWQQPWWYTAPLGDGTTTTYVGDVHPLASSSNVTLRIGDA